MASLMRAIKAAIKTRLATLTSLDADTIHPRRRNFGGQNEAYFEGLFTTGVGDAARVNGWEIEHESGTSAWLATNKAWDRRDVIVLRGYYGWDDEHDSEGTFSQIVEDVIEVLNADQTIGTSTLTAADAAQIARVRTHGTAQVRSYGPGTLGSKLVHYAEIALTIAWANQIT